MAVTDSKWISDIFGDFWKFGFKVAHRSMWWQSSQQQNWKATVRPYTEFPWFPVEHGLWTLDLWSVSASGENGRKMTFWPFCIRTEWDLGDFLDARACGGCPKDVRDEAEGHFRRRQRCSQLARLARVDFWLCIDNRFRVRAELILTWLRGHRDHEGGSPRARPFHCTSVGLTPAIIPNVDNSGVQFLLAG